MNLHNLSGRRYVGLAALSLAIASVTIYQRAEANPVRETLDDLLDALGSISQALDNTHVDSWSDTASGGIFLNGWARSVPTMQDKYFELNASIACSFTQQTNDQDINTARILIRRSPLDSFLLVAEVKSSDQVIQLNTGPIVGYQYSPSYVYVVNCSPGGDNEFSRVFVTAAFKELPEPDTGNTSF